MVTQVYAVRMFTYCRIRFGAMIYDITSRPILFHLFTLTFLDAERRYDKEWNNKCYDEYGNVLLFHILAEFDMTNLLQ